MINPPTSEDRSDKYDRLVQWTKQAVRDAQQESRDMGVSNVYSINGKLLYELPSGELSLTPPKSQQPTKSAD